jgi:hypothetical protein
MSTGAWRCGAAFAATGLLAAAPAAWIGVEMPLAGDDGGRGLAAAAAIRLGLGATRIVVRDSANGGFLNPHRDEGSDNGGDLRTAPSIVSAFGRDRNIVAAVGGLRRSCSWATPERSPRRGRTASRAS